MHPTSLRLRAGAALAALAFATAAFAADAITPTKPIALFNGKDLAGWKAFAKEGDAVAAASWSVTGGVIKCTGKPNGYLRTEANYRDYRLTVEWRFDPAPMPLNPQGQPRARNSGVLLDMQGEDAVWPKCLEAQLMEKNAGDFYVVGGVEFAEFAAARDKALAAAADDAAKAKIKTNRRTPKFKDSSEKPTGEWNTYDIVCRGDTVVLRVNGVEQNRATGLSVREGRILLQSEGAPVEFRNVKLEPLN
jgi:hypothetical protein